ncbi:MAG: YIP1 family protein [Candidatus Nanohaloarchaea archaeon]|nr:YIP1 family protein [Candidatus Nanohaloarchaea archaeon]
MPSDNKAEPETVLMKHIKDIGDMLSSPSSCFERLKSQDLGMPFGRGSLGFVTYLAIIQSVGYSILLAALLSALPIELSALPGISSSLLPIILFYFAVVWLVTVIASFVEAILLHTFVCLVAEHKDFEEFLETYNVVAYGSTPMFLLGWIPLINLLVAIWEFRLFFVGIMEVQGLKRKEAAAAVFMFVILPIFLVFIF